MQKPAKEFETDDEEGIKALLRALKCNLAAADGVKQVQNMFIELRKIRKRYRLRVALKQIIWWLTSNLGPEKVK